MDIEAATQAYIATISPDVLAAAKAYTIGNHWLVLWNLVVTVIIAIILVRWGVLARIRDRINGSGVRPSRVALVVAAAYLALDWLLQLPWAVYSGWLRETSYGLTKQDFADWLTQAVIGAGVTIVFGGLFFTGLFALMRWAGRRWWLWGGGFAAAAFTFALLISPVVVEPLFNNYTPIADGPVKDEIVALAKASNVPTDRIFIYDGSRQRSILTANVSGFAGSMRIAVSDVAMKEASLPEVRAVVAHEIGHYVSGDIVKLIALLSVLALSGFFVIERVFSRVATWMGGANVTGVADPAGLPVFIALISVWFTLCQPISNSFTRIFEANADAYSAQIANEPDGMATALLKSVEYRDPTPSRLTEIIFHNHPSIERRIRAAMTWKAAHLPPPPPPEPVAASSLTP